jgi:hypothetical protein
VCLGLVALEAHVRRAAAGLLVVLASPEPELWRWNLPDWSREIVASAEKRDHLTLSNRLNPFYLQGDFDGDGRLDLAALVESAKDRKAGILVLLRARSDGIVLGAGRPVGDHGDDFSWMDVWSVYPKGPVGRGADEKVSPRLRGDALLVEKSEAASALLYWNGKGFGWYQQGD